MEILKDALWAVREVIINLSLRVFSFFINYPNVSTFALYLAAGILAIVSILLGGLPWPGRVLLDLLFFAIGAMHLFVLAPNSKRVYVEFLLGWIFMIFGVVYFAVSFLDWLA